MTGVNTEAQSSFETKKGATKAYRKQAGCAVPTRLDLGLLRLAYLELAEHFQAKQETLVARGPAAGLSDGASLPPTCGQYVLVAWLPRQA